MGTIAVKVYFSPTSSCMVAVDILGGLGRESFFEVLARALPFQLRGLPIVGFLAEGVHQVLARQQDAEERDRVERHTRATPVMGIPAIGDDGPTVVAPESYGTGGKI